MQVGEIQHRAAPAGQDSAAGLGRHEVIGAGHRLVPVAGSLLGGVQTCVQPGFLEHGPVCSRGFWVTSCRAAHFARGPCRLQNRHRTRPRRLVVHQVPHRDSHPVRCAFGRLTAIGPHTPR